MRLSAGSNPHPLRQSMRSSELKTPHKFGKMFYRRRPYQRFVRDGKKRVGRAMAWASYCPLRPQKQTFVSALSMSAKCQKATLVVPWHFLRLLGYRREPSPTLVVTGAFAPGKTAPTEVSELGATVTGETEGCDAEPPVDAVPK